MLNLMKNVLTDVNIGTIWTNLAKILCIEQIIDVWCTDKTEIINFGGKQARLNCSAWL